MEEIDELVENVKPYRGKQMTFTHIGANNSNLRPYQVKMKEDVYQQWDKCDNVMLQMPTGTGKTIVFTSIVNDIRKWCLENDPKAKILIVAHRRELISQASNKLGQIPHGVIMSGCSTNYTRMIQVASIQTFMSKRNYSMVKDIPFDFIIIDEAHHALANTYQNLWTMYPNSKKLGVTATPCRLDHEGFTSLFSELILANPIKWFINEGYLANYTYISIRPTSKVQQTVDCIQKFGVDGDYLNDELSTLFDKDSIRAELYKSYAQFTKGKKGIIYAIDRQHAANIKELYAANGVNVKMIDSTTPLDERNEIINQFKHSKSMVIVNVNIFSEGFDCPDIEFIQLARPTKSLAMYLQQVGRGLRPSEGKDYTIILDNVGLYNRFGTPMADRKWKYHFKGSEVTKDVCSATSSELRDVEGREADYSEGNEDMVMVEHCEGGKQCIDKGSENVEADICDYNIFKKNGYYGVCSRSNRTIIQPIYEDMHPYSNGYIPFKQNGKWGILLSNGVVKVRPKYFYIGAFKDGIAEVIELENSVPYYINSKLEKVKI